MHYKEKYRCHQTIFFSHVNALIFLNFSLCELEKVHRIFNKGYKKKKKGFLKDLSLAGRALKIIIQSQNWDFKLSFENIALLLIYLHWLPALKTVADIYQINVFCGNLHFRNWGKKLPLFHTICWMEESTFYSLRYYMFRLLMQVQKFAFITIVSAGLILPCHGEWTREDDPFGISMRTW